MKLRPRAFARIAVIALLALSPAVGERNSKKMKISISLGGDRFIARESMVLTVVVTNTGSSAIEIPDPGDGRNTQPEYAIQGPSYPQGHKIVFGRPLKPGQPSPEPVLVKLAPGEEHESELPLEMAVKFPEPGKHTLVAKLSWAGASAVSAPVSFMIEAPVLHAARIMADDGFQRPGMQRVLALAGQPPKLYQFMFREQRPGIGEIRFAKMVPAAVPPPEATDVIAPWTNFDRSDVFYFRTGWRTPAAVGMETDTPVQRATAAIEAGSEVIHPALMAKDGAASVLVRTAKEILLIQLPLPAEEKAPPPSQTIWKANLEHPAIAACAAVAPAPLNKPFALTVGQGMGNVAVTLFESGASKGKHVEIPAATLPPDSQPALWIDSSAQAHAAILVADPDAPRNLSLVLIDWMTAEPEAKVTRKSVSRLPRDAKSSVAAFSVSDRRPPRLDWVVLLDDGSLVSSKSPGSVQRFPSAPVRPLQLLSMSQAMYLLTTDAVDILRFRNLQ